MAIPDEDVAQVRAATDMVALVGEQTALKRVGRRYVGLCPFHSENSGSFSVNAEEGLYYCFGCQASGDAISFVRAVEGCDFVEAVERLAARAGIAIRHDDEGAPAQHGRRKQLYDVLAAAAAFYHERLLTARDAGGARQYLRARGYDGAVVRQFRLGYAPAGFDELVRALHLPTGLLVEAGLAFDGRERGRDAFRERIIFPIFDPGGRPIALGGRVLPPELRTSDRDPGPKYRNSPESSVYQKRRTLYGLNWAKQDMVRAGEAVVCEGYTDVIGFFRAGVPRAVATCGTSLTEEHLRLLANFAKRVVLAFDADSAGQNATARIYEWERRHSLELAVAILPAGSDPAELAGSDPDGLANAVRDARPFLAFQVERAIGASDLGSPEGRSRAAESALARVAEHPSELVRDQYLVEIADRTHHDPERLRPLLETLRRASPVGPSGSKRGGAARRPDSTRAAAEPLPSDDWPAYDDPGGDGSSTSSPVSDVGRPPSGDARQSRRGSGPDEAVPRTGRGRRPRASRAGLDGLALAVHRPVEVAELFDAVLFTDPLQREAFEVLASASELHEAIAASAPSVADLLLRIAVADLETDADPLGTFVALTRAAAEAALAAFGREARAAERSGSPAGTREHLEKSGVVRRDLELLRDAGDSLGPGVPAIDAAKRLVAWMVQREEDGGGWRAST
ncbi:MAG: DNA primase [Acidimicrobiales bacterium]